METKKNTEKKRTGGPVDTVRDGAIGASIFVSQSPDGNQSHYYVLSRCWKNQTSGQFKYTDRMYPRNAEAVAKVSEMAAARCKELDDRIDGDAVVETGAIAAAVHPAQQAAR